MWSSNKLARDGDAEVLALSEIKVLKGSVKVWTSSFDTGNERRKKPQLSITVSQIPCC